LVDCGVKGQITGEQLCFITSARQVDIQCISIQQFVDFALTTVGVSSWCTWGVFWYFTLVCLYRERKIFPYFWTTWMVQE